MKCSWAALNGMKKESARLVVSGKTWTFAKRIKILKVWVRCVLDCYIYAIGLYFFKIIFTIIMLLRIICKCFIFLGVLPTIYTNFHVFSLFWIQICKWFCVADIRVGAEICQTQIQDGCVFVLIILCPQCPQKLWTMFLLEITLLQRKTFFIQRTILISSQECLQMVTKLKNSFVNPSCLGQPTTNNLPKRSILTSVSVKI